MEWRSLLVPSDRGSKVRTTIEKGSKVQRSLLVEPAAAVSPARRKNLTMAVHNKAKYDPIGVGNGWREDEERRLLLNKEYRVHQLCELIFPCSANSRMVPVAQETYEWWPGTGQVRQR
jgi:hypothetical protein